MDPGTRLGAYVVEKRLGAGAMGEVFKVVNAETGKACALKLLSPAFADEPELAERFQRELLTQARLSGHPNVVGVLDVGRDSRGVPFFVMDLVEGPTWRQAMDDGQLISDGLKIVSQIGGALEAAHTAGLVHRDVKPANVMIDAEGNGRLTDFGVVAAGEASDLTRPGQMFGTVTYMAPELANSAHAPTGPWTDVYGLGAILYELLTGRTPLVGTNSMLLLTTLVGDPNAIRPPQEHRPNVDPALAEIAMRALAHRPEERYATAADMVRDLERARRGEAISPAQARAAAELKMWKAASGSEHVILGPREGPMATVVEEDEPDLSFDEPEVEHEGKGWLEPFVYLLALVCVIGVGFAAYKTLQEKEPDARTETISWIRLDRHIRGGKWDAAMSEAARLKAKFPAETEAVEARMVTVYLGRAEGAFNADNIVAARQALPENVPESFAPLGWILALSGDAQAACSALDNEENTIARLHVAAWAGDLQRCEALLKDFEPEQAHAYRWILSEFVPELRPSERDIGKERSLDDWALLARARESLGRGLTSLAVLDLEALRQDTGQRELMLEIELGRVEAFVARGEVEEAARALAEATRHARGRIERARCLGWAATIQLALDTLPAALTSQLGEDPTFEAEKFAPGTPRVVRARLAREVERAHVQETPAEFAGPLRQAFARERMGLRADGASPFAEAEVDRCRSGADGALGALVARAADRGLLCFRGGERTQAKAAEDLVKRATLLCPESPAAWIAKAQLELARHRGSEATAALQRAAFLAPHDPYVALWVAIGQRARASIFASDRDREGFNGVVRDDSADLTAAYEAALAQFEALAKQGGYVGDCARRSGAETALEFAWRAAPDSAEAKAAFARAEALLEDWVPADLEEVAGRRQLLWSSDAEARKQATRQLSASLATLSSHSLVALRLLAHVPGPRGRAAGQAYLALAGDLPARAHLALKRGDLSPQGWEPALAEAEALAPAFPAVRFARGAEGQTINANALESLLRAGLARSDLFQVGIALCFRTADRDPRETLLQAFDPSSDPAWAHLARAFVLRTEPIPTEGIDAPSRERNQAFMRELARLGVVETHRALCAGQRDPAAFILSAMFHAGLAEGARRQSPPDERVRLDVLHFMHCAQAGAPRSQSVQRLALNWSNDVPQLLDLLIAGGNTGNAGILRLGPQQNTVDENLQPLRPLLEGQVKLEDVAQLESLITVLQESQVYPALSAALSFALARRNLRKSLPYLLAGVGEWSNRRPGLSSFVRAQQIRLGARVSGGTMDGAAEAAFVGWQESRSAGADWPNAAQAGDMVPVVVGKDVSEWHSAGRYFTPFNYELAGIWWRLNEPAVHLAFLADQLNGEAHPDPARGMGRWSRARALLWTLSEGTSQARLVPKLAAAGSWTEAAAASFRAASSHRQMPPGMTLERLTRQIRDASLSHAERANALEPALLVCREGQRFDSGLAWLEAALLLDRGGLQGDDSVVTRALELARGSIGGDDSLEKLWTLARAEVVAGEPLSFLSELESLAEARAAQIKIARWIKTDPWAESLRKSPLAPLAKRK